MAGRKQRNNADYFPHFVRASRTKGILKSKFGHEGYSVWYQLLEILSATENHYYDCSDEIVYEYLLAEIGTSDETFKSIIDFLVRVGKIDRDLWNQDRIIWCQKLVDNLAYVYDKRVSNVPQKPALKEKKKPKPSISGPELSISGPEMQRREEKRNKEKKSKEKTDFVFPECFSSEKFKQAFDEFVKFRKSINKRMTDRAKELLILRLEKLSGGSDSEAVAMLDQSVMSGWLNVYPIKSEQRNGRYAPSEEDILRELEGYGKS